ncbi:MAG: hypothetical protein J0L87_08025 [Bacteroidetes bacterium]|nr:hypothetical protein [Bacteroidota bacterium]
MTIIIIIIIVLVWITIMTLIFWMMPQNKVKTAQDFFKDVIPKVPIAGIIEVFRNKKA